MKNLTIEWEYGSLFLVGHDIPGVVIEISFNASVEKEAMEIAQQLAAAPELLEENKRLREALELALKTLQDIQGKYYGDPIPDSVFGVVTSALK